MKTKGSLYAFLVMLALLLVIGDNVLADTTVSGGIHADTVWTTTGSPYNIVSDAALFPGYTLTIEPGVEVRFTDGVILDIRGSLIAEGTQTNWIVFTSANPGTRGSYVGTTLRGSASIKFANFSYAQYAVDISFDGVGPVNIYDSMFSNNVVAIGGYAGWNMIIESCTFDNNTCAITSADKIISNSVFTNNEYGLCGTERVSVFSSTFTGNQTALYGGRGAVRCSNISNNGIGIESFFEGFSLSKNTIANNDVGVILGYDAYTPPIDYNNIYDNATYNLKTSGPADKYVPNIWWGTTNTTMIDAKIYDGYDDVSLGLVYYQPILTDPIARIYEEMGVFRVGTWYLDHSGDTAWSGCATDICYSFGLSTDRPVSGDWSGDSLTKIGVFRDGTWFLDHNGNGAWDECGTDTCGVFGMTGDIPVTGDWNNSGIFKMGIFRDGSWFLDANGNGAWDGCGTDTCGAFGMTGDIPVTGDWDNSGIFKMGIFRDGSWFLDANGNGAWDGCGTDTCGAFGMAGDVPVVGDWNGSGKSTMGVFRNGTWFLDYNGNGAWDGCDIDKCVSFGMTGDEPVVGIW